MIRLLPGACALAIAAAAVAVGSAGAGPGDGPRKADDQRRAVVELLHAGRFDEADRLAERLAPEGETPAEAFFRAFVTYWRLLYDEDDPGLQAELERRLDHTLEVANGEVEGQAADELALWRGSAHLLRAQLRAAQKRVLAAGFDAKKAHRLLREAVEAGGREAESNFGLGSYDYFASTVPGIVKALRRLLTIPGGDRDDGLERLHEAADASHFFAVEARLVLMRIYADDKERLYDRALGEARTALEQHPGVIATLLASARLDLALARPAQALAQIEQARRLAAAEPATSRSVVGALLYWAGVAELDRFRPDRALSYLEPIVTGPSEFPKDLVAKADRLAGSCVWLLRAAPAWAGDISRESFANAVDPAQRGAFRRAAASLDVAREALELERQGRIEDAAARLEALAAVQGDDPLLSLLAGRAQMLAMQPDRAQPRLDAVATAQQFPDLWIGPSRLLAGLASDLCGQRNAALAWYGLAEQVRFNGRDAARRCQERACTGRDLDPVPAVFGAVDRTPGTSGPAGAGAPPAPAPQRNPH